MFINVNYRHRVLDRLPMSLYLLHEARISASDFQLINP